MLDLFDNWFRGFLDNLGSSVGIPENSYSPNIGDHIYVPRSLSRDLKKCDDFNELDYETKSKFLVVSSIIGYTHHGIYIGNNKVIHYDGEPGREEAAEIQIADLEKFSAGDPIHLYSDESDFTPGEIVARAHYRLGEKKYSVGNNNCQHFCNWCRSDHSDNCYYPEVNMATVMKKFSDKNNSNFSMQLSSYNHSDYGIVLGGTVSSGSISVGDKIKVIQQPRKGHLSEVTHNKDEEIATLTVKKIKKNRYCGTAKAGDTIELTVDRFVSCINMFNYLIVK